MLTSTLRSLIREFLLREEENPGIASSVDSTLVLAKDVPSPYTAQLQSFSYIPANAKSAYALVTKADPANPKAPAKVIVRQAKTTPGTALSLAGGLPAYEKFCLDADNSTRDWIKSVWLGIRPTKEWVSSMLELKFPDGSRIFESKEQVDEYCKYLTRMAYEMPIIHIINDPALPKSSQTAALKMLEIGENIEAFHGDNVGFCYPLISYAGFKVFGNVSIEPNKTDKIPTPAINKEFARRLKEMYDTVPAVTIVEHEFTHAEEILLLTFSNQILKKRQKGKDTPDFTAEQLRTSRLGILKDAVAKNAADLINAKTEDEIVAAIGKLKGTTITPEMRQSPQYYELVIRYARVLYNLGLMENTHPLYAVATANGTLLANSSKKADVKGATGQATQNISVASMVVNPQYLNMFPQYINQVLGISGDGTLGAAPQETTHLITALRLMQQNASSYIDALRKNEDYDTQLISDEIISNLNSWGENDAAVEIDKPRIQVIFDLVGANQVADIVKSFAALDNTKGPTTA